MAELSKAYAAALRDMDAKRKASEAAAIDAQKSIREMSNLVHESHIGALNVRECVAAYHPTPIKLSVETIKWMGVLQGAGEVVTEHTLALRIASEAAKDFYTAMIEVLRAYEKQNTLVLDE